MLAAGLVTCLYGSLFSCGGAGWSHTDSTERSTGTSNAAGVGLRTPWGVRDILRLCTGVERRGSKNTQCPSLLLNYNGYNALVG